MHVRHENILLVGTSHIAEQSLEEIDSLFNKHNVAVVAVELDQQRLTQLMHGDQGESKKYPFFRLVRELGFGAAIFANLASWVQQKVGKIVGLSPGSDMKHAVELARSKQVPLACIDQDIRVTLRKISPSINLIFFWKAGKEALTGFLFPKRMARRYGMEKINLKKVPPERLIDKALLALKKSYPGIYEVLVRQRNHYMTRNLRQLQEQYPDKIILAVVGAGYLKGIASLLQSSYMAAG